MARKRQDSDKSPTIPATAREAYDAVVTLTDGFCREHLNAEYEALCRNLAAALARRRPSPLAGGRPQTWACGIVRTIGWVNFLDDPENTPHMKLTAVDKVFGVAESTGQGKSRAIRTMLKIGTFDTRWTLPSRMDENPMLWLLEINGFVVDARRLSREFQEAALRKGLIPYIPGERPDESVET